MREAFLVLIIISEIVIALTWNSDIDTGSLSFLTTLIVVVISAFTSSALLRNIKKLTLSRNYAISGILGIAIGYLFYSWISIHLDATVEWLKNYGLYILLLIILISAFMLYITKGHKAKVIEAPKVPEPMGSEIETPEESDGIKNSENQ